MANSRLLPYTRAEIIALIGKNAELVCGDPYGARYGSYPIVAVQPVGHPDDPAPKAAVIKPARYGTQHIFGYDLMIGKIMPDYSTGEPIIVFIGDGTFYKKPENAIKALSGWSAWILKA